jgi:hypothetical protein
MTTVWPLAYTGLLTLLPTLPGWSATTVYDGAPESGDAPGTDGVSRYIAVGFVEDEQGAGSFQQNPDGDGYFDIETGEVRSELYVGNGDGDLAGARTAAFALIDSLKAALAADRTIAGALPHGSTSSVSADVLPAKDSNGAGVLLILSVSYTAPVT